MSAIHLRIVTPEGVYHEADTPYLNFQTVDGDRGLLPEHMPLVTSLKIGKMSDEENGKRTEYAVSGGLLYFHDNTAELLSDAVESKDDIDLKRAEDSAERARKRIAENNPNIDMRRAQASLARALNRIAVKNE